MQDSVYDLYSYSDYKALIRERLPHLRKSKPALSWKWVADKVPMQPTYLSKALNPGKAHLSEDDLFRIGQWLDFKPDEVDYILLLRAQNISTQKERKEFLTKKINDIKKRRVISVEYVETHAQSLNHEMAYMLDPLTVIIHVALFIPQIKSDPLRLCSHLAISREKLKSSLEILSQCEYVKLGEKPFHVEKVFSRALHFGRQHPLTRTHQTALKAMLLSRLGQTPEESKESFLVTFTMKESGFVKVKAAFDDFLKKTRDIAQNEKGPTTDKVYQLNFDLLEWF